MAGRGGVRPGAGRKPKEERFASKIAAAEKRIADRLPVLIDNLFELANGVTVQEVDAEGNQRVYTRPPCFKSNSYLIDRILGKPTQPQELSGPEGGPIPVTITEAIDKVYGQPGQPDGQSSE